MHIILGFLSALGLIALVLWRISTAIQASRDIADAANDARGFFRRSKWRSKVNVDQLRQISDPREAATIMMVAVAESDGAITDREQNKILHIIMEKFEATQQTAEEFLARARWLTKGAGDLSGFLDRLKPVIQKCCTEEQKLELIDMLREVAEVDGRRDTDVVESIARLKRNIM